MREVYVDNTLFDSLSEFVYAEGIQVELTRDDHSDVRILVCSDSKESDSETLYSGSWIMCPTALAMAKKLQIPTLQMGALLDHLNIKIKNCSLGCFQ